MTNLLRQQSQQIGIAENYHNRYKGRSKNPSALDTRGAFALLPFDLRQGCTQYFLPHEASRTSF